jgi:hypothetical protein
VEMFMRTYRSGTNFAIDATRAPGQLGHAFIGLLGKNGKIRLVEPQTRPISLLPGPAPDFTSFTVIAVKPARR